MIIGHGDVAGVLVEKIIWGLTSTPPKFTLVRPRNMKRFLSISLLFILFFAFSPPAFAQTPSIIVGANLSAYTPPTGSDCNINVPSQYSTIQAGIDAATSGDTVCVGPGTYNESVKISKSVRLSGSGVAQSIINGQVNPGYLSPTIEFNANDITLEGFYINGISDSGFTVHNMDASYSGNNIRYNWIKAGNGQVNLTIYGSQLNSLIHNNIFEGNNSPQLATVYSSGSTDYLDNVDFVSNTFMGTVTQGGAIFSSAAKNSTIKWNVFNTNDALSLLVYIYPLNIVNENNFDVNPTGLVYGRSNIKVMNPYGESLNAENNWWGDTDPSDNIQGIIDYMPFATSPFPEYPSSLNQPPVANAGPDQTVFVGDSVNFDGAQSTDPDGNSDIVNYNWGFGDGNNGNNGSGVTTSHTYTNSGTYIVTLTVTDSEGATSSDTLTVIVETPTQATDSLIELVQTFNLQQGIENSLDAKLDAAIDALSDLNTNNDSAAINSLYAFINNVEAQSGNQLTVNQANTLIQEAQDIINHI